MKLSTKIVIIVLSISLVPLILAGVLSLTYFQNIVKDQILEERALIVEYATESLGVVLNTYEEELLILKDFPPIQGIIRTEDNSGIDPLDGSTIVFWEERLQTIFSSMIDVRENIDQLRYIDETGQELIRVNRLDDSGLDSRKLEVVLKKDLQNKADRDYFIETMKLDKGEVYVSELDLNIENGQIEIPYKPVLRFATPIFSETGGERRGILIMNIKGEPLIEFLELYGKINNLILTDEKGYFIFSLDDEKEFSKYLETGYNYFNEQPELISNIQRADSKIYHDERDKEFRTWKKIYYDKTDSEKYWILFLIDREEDLLAPLISLRNGLIIFFFCVLIISGGFAFYLSRSISKPVKKLHKLALDIEGRNFKSRVDIKSKDELGFVGDNFNRAMEALEKIEEEHKQVDKAKTEFLSITSHELRSPMTPMQAQLQLLSRGTFGKLTKKQKDSLDIVLRNTKRLDNIIVDFLEISRAEAGRLKFNFMKTNLNNHVNRLVKEMDGFLPEKKIKIETQLDKLPFMEVDPDRVMQVLRNLINNAKKFSPDGSKITIRAKLKKDMIEFSVSDQGIGIPLAKQGDLFTPFYQVENMYQRKSGGTGLGLAICKGIVQAQNGRIWVESTQNKGTTFHFTVPLRPVKDVKPIKLLFSNKSNLDNKVRSAYIENLGPLGEAEFKSLGSDITPETVLSNIKKLESEKILTIERVDEFKRKIIRLFGKSSTFAIDKKTRVRELEYLAEQKKVKIDYKKLMEQLIAKVRNIYGDVALRKVELVEGLVVSKEGKILEMNGDAKIILSRLEEVYRDVAGDLTRFIKEKEFLRLLSKK